METLNEKQLNDASVYPDEKILKHVLGRSYRAYSELIRLYDEKQMVHEWRYYRDGKAWLCKVQRKKRTIVWMSAWKGYMQATVYIPEKHIEEINTLDISETVKEKIRNTKNIGRSKPCIFEVRNQHVLKDLEKVMRFKMAMK
jgi:hypothetical protein